MILPSVSLINTYAPPYRSSASRHQARAGYVTATVNVVLIGAVHLWDGVTWFEMLKSAMKLLNSYLEIPEVLVDPRWLVRPRRHW